jgi:glucosylceramidase
MDGFGAAITGSTAYNLLKMRAEDRAVFFKETFSVSEGLGFSYVRVSIGCSDFSLSEYTCCDTEGIENFALQSEEREYIIPILKEILAINPNLKIMASPWTCPKWMKVNSLEEMKPIDSWTGGHLNPKYYEDYATYFVRWIKDMEAAGIPIYSVTLQNEPLNHLNSASLCMWWNEQADFIKKGIGPAFEAAGIKTKVYLFDHNYNYDRMAEQYRYPIRIYDDTDVSKYVAGAAYHNYSGEVEELDTIHTLAPSKELVFTETSIGEWNDGRNLKTRLTDDMIYVGLKNINKWCRGVIVWNLMLDSNKGPNREKGCRSCYGAVDIDTVDYKTISRNSHYYIIGHLSKVVSPGAVRIYSSEMQDENMESSAFKNLDGSIAMVMANGTDSLRIVSIQSGDTYLNIDMPAKSVVSVKWK